MSDTYVVASFEETGVKPPNLESSRSGVSWGAILAGGVTAAAISLILLSIGAGLGLVSLSPYAGDSVSITGLAVGAIIWLIVAQWIASLFGGYIAGRLRTKWADRHSDEVFFRDTAHGLLSWAVATLLTVAVFSLGALSAAAIATNGAAAVASQADDAYFVDEILRAPAGAETAAPSTQPVAAADENARAEISRLLARSIAGTANDSDRTYLAQRVAARTGLTPDEAQQRVDQVIAAAKEAADNARKAAATASLMTAFSLLVGAFIAAVAGGLGGKYRDELQTT